MLKTSCDASAVAYCPWKEHAEAVWNALRQSNCLQARKSGESFNEHRPEDQRHSRHK